MKIEMSVKALVLGDPHFKLSNLLEVDRLVEYFCDLIKLHHPTLVIILGDVLHDHEKLHIIPYNRAVKFFRKILDLGTELFVLVGNHDMTSQNQFLTENHWMTSLKEWEGLTVVDRPLMVDRGDVKLTMCPYVPNGRFIEALDYVSGWKKSSMIFAHQEFMGCQMLNFKSETGDRWSSEYPPLISGHIHSYQWIGNVFYPGSAMQHSFGDTQKRVIPLVTFESGSHKIDEIKSIMPVKRTIYKDCKDSFDASKIDIQNTRIVVRDTRSSITAFKKSQTYRELQSKNVNIQFKESDDSLKTSDNTSYKGEDGFVNILNRMVSESGDSDIDKILKSIGF
jgi:DNA repair exonuclease SbcCD nuclease subunit